MGRDNARTPMQWDSGPNAGFTTGTPWIEVNENFRIINAAAERADPDSVFHHYRRLIALRHEDPVVALGDFTMLLPDHEHVYAFTRSLGDVTLTVLGNFSGSVQDVRARRRPGRADPVELRRTGPDAAPVGGAGLPTRGLATAPGRGRAPGTLTRADP